MKLNNWLRALRVLPAAVLMICFLTACTENDLNDLKNSAGDGIANIKDGVTNAVSTSDNPDFKANGEPVLSDPSYERPPETVAMPESSGQVKSDRGASIDYGNASKGYVMASCESSENVRFVLTGMKGGDKVVYMTYVLNNEGTPEVFPLPETDTEYTMEVYVNVPSQGSNMYDKVLSKTMTVSLENQFGPFLLPSQVVNYTPDSPAVKKAQELIVHCSNNNEVVEEVYYWVDHNIKYDTAKAGDVQSGYVPDPEQTLSSKDGICYDYAALVATMLRSSGVPCKLVKGNVKTPEGAVYHAWNEIYLEEAGWIAIGIQTTPDQWERIDLTFAASGGSTATKLIGDGSNYAPTSYE